MSPTSRSSGLFAPERIWVLKLLVAIAALVLGASATLEIHQSPFGLHPLLDEEMYIEWARTIAARGVVGTSAFFFDPLYAYFLAALLKLFSGSLLWCRVAQVALWVGTVVLLMQTGTRLFGAVAGVIAGALLAVEGPAVFENAFLLKEGLLLHLTVWLCWAIVRAQDAGDAARFRFFWPGLVLGLLCLLRGNFLLLIPLAALWVLAVSCEGPWSRRLALTCSIVAGLALPLGLSTAHNVAAAGEWVPTTTHGGPNFFIGNNPDANGAYVAPPFVRPGPRWEITDFQAEAERRLGRSLGRKQVSDYWLGEGLHFWSTQPGAGLALLLRKVQLLANAYEVPDNYSFECVRTHFAPSLWLAFLNLGLLLGPALVGMALAVRHEPRSRPLVATAAVYAGSVVVFFVLDRYRAPLIPLYCLFAAHFVASGVAAVRQARWSLPLKGGLVAVALSAAAQLPTPVSARRPFHFARCLHLAGTTLVDVGRVDEGIDLLVQSATLAPDQNDAEYNLGRAYQLGRRLEEARGAYERALAREPAHGAASFNLGLVLYDLGDTGGAVARFEQARAGGLRTARLFGALAMAQQKLGHLESARDAWELAHQLDPADARVGLGLLEALDQLSQCARVEQLLAEQPELAGAARGKLERHCGSAAP